MRITLLIISILYVLSINAQEWQWAKQFEDSSLNTAAKMITDDEGYTTMMGSFRSRDLIWGNDTLRPISRSDFFIAQLDSGGNPTWIIQGINKIGRSGTGGSLRDIDVDDEGNIYITGTYVDTLTLGDQRITNRFTSNVKVQNFFYAKILKDGGLQFLKHAEGERFNYCESITHHNGRIYIAGLFIQDIFISGKQYGSDTTFYNDFIAEIDDEGEVIWLKPLANIDNITAGPNGDIHIFGLFSDSIRLGSTIIKSPAQRGFYYAKLDANGELDETSIKIGWVGSDLVSDRIDIADAEEDALGNIIFTGYFKGSFLQYDSEVITKTGELTQFIIKIDSTGHLKWHKSTGSVRVPWALKPDIDIVKNRIYYYSTFDNQLDLDIGKLESRGGVDGILLILDGEGNTLFADHYGGQTNEFGFGVSVNDNNKVWIFGEYQKQLKLGEEIELEGVTLNNVYIAKADFSEITSISNKLNHPEYFKVYPNPTKNSIRIPDGLRWKEAFVLNSSGILMFRTSKNINEEGIIDVSDFNSGLYIFTLINETKYYLSKFIRE